MSDAKIREALAFFVQQYETLQTTIGWTETDGSPGGSGGEWVGCLMDNAYRRAKEALKPHAVQPQGEPVATRWHYRIIPPSNRRRTSFYAKDIGEVRLALSEAGIFFDRAFRCINPAEECDGTRCEPKGGGK